MSLFHLLRDEESLMLEFFPDLANIGSAAQDYFDSICVIFYDHLRPKIVKLHHLETLSEISSILKVELMEHTSVSSNTGKNKELKVLRYFTQGPLNTQIAKYIVGGTQKPS